MKQTVAAYIAKTLESAGVKRIWGVTGDSLNGLSDSLNRMGTIEWMSTRHGVEFYSKQKQVQTYPQQQPRYS